MKKNSTSDGSFPSFLTVEFVRLDIQDRVRRLLKDPREDARIEIERLRQNLAAEFLLLQSFTQINAVNTHENELEDTDANEFDDLDNDVNDASPDRPAELNGCGRIHAESDIMPPERRPVILPSTHMPHNQALKKAELTLRVRQATRYLAAIREAVAEKSFQFSHVLRAAPSKGVRTRSRGMITKLNERISLWCRIYGRAQTAMVRLGADNKLLDKYHTLRKEDVRASTAIVNPNIPGSSSVKLSWIWQTQTHGVGPAPDTMRECESFLFAA